MGCGCPVRIAQGGQSPPSIGRLRKVSTCTLVIEEWNDAQRGGGKITQRGVRLSEVPIDGADDMSVTPDGVPVSEISVADDLASTQRLAADAPDGVGRWNERCDCVVVATNEATPFDDALFAEERRDT